MKVEPSSGQTFAIQIPVYYVAAHDGLSTRFSYLPCTV